MEKKTNKDNFHILLGCFDVSGDHHAADLIKYTSVHYPNKFSFSAFAGQEVKKLAAEKTNDVTIIEETVIESSVGLLEGIPFVIPTIKFFKRVEKYILASKNNVKKFLYETPKSKKIIPLKPIDLFLCIDGQGKNLLLAKKFRKEGILVAYFFPPPVFIWGRWHSKSLKEYDLILCPFAENNEILLKAGCHSIYTGHPLAVKEKIIEPTKKIYDDLKISAKKPFLSIFPGSRLQEVKKTTIPFLKAALILMERNKELQCAISLAHQDLLPYIKAKMEQLSKKNPQKKELMSKISIIYGKWDEILACSTFGFLCSGTVTLRAALIGTPHLIAYYISTLSFLIGWFLAYVKFIGIVNILAKREVVPEFINWSATVKKFTKIAEPLLMDQQKRKEKQKELQHCMDKIYCKNPYGIVIKEIIKTIKSKKR